MPIRKGKSVKTMRANITELMDAWRKTGKIGHTTPKDKAHARDIAISIAKKKHRETALGGRR